MNLFKKGKRLLYKGTLCIALLIASPLALASFTGVIDGDVQGSALIKSQQVNNLRINWTGTSIPPTSTPLGQSYQITSSSGLFLVGQNAVATNNQTVSTTLIAGGGNSFSISERVTIPLSVLVAAEQANITQVQYVRNFTDGSDSTTAFSVVNLQIVSANSGPLSLSQIDLRFSNDQISMIVNQNESFNAYAEITHSGRGLFTAVWEIATPVSTSGTPIFTTLKTVRQLLGARRNTIIESPVLPTELTGVYLLRLRITAPEVATNDLGLRYSVIEGQSALLTPEVITINNPPANSVVDQKTKFSWQEIGGVSSYQLEIYDGLLAGLPVVGESLDVNADQPLITGVLLPSSQAFTSITPLMLQRLKTGRAYQWRIVAKNAQGQIVGLSSIQKMIYRQ